MNNRGEFLTKLVNMNSKRVENLARIHKAWVWPRNFDFACLMFAEIIVLKPILKFIFELVCDIQSNLKLVTISEPRSPLFPFVSSTLLMESDNPK